MISSSATLDDSPQTSMEGLAFLVTHWLANLDHDRNNQDDVDRGRIPVEGDRGNDTDQYEEQQQQRRQAVERIRIATTELASAFSVLGAFGTTLPVSSMTYPNFLEDYLDSVGLEHISLPNRILTGSCVCMCACVCTMDIFFAAISVGIIVGTSKCYLFGCSSSME